MEKEQIKKTLDKIASMVQQVAQWVGDDGDDSVSLKNAAILLKLPEHTVRRMANDGRLSTLPRQSGQMHRFKRAEIDRYAKEHGLTPANAPQAQEIDLHIVSEKTAEVKPAPRAETPEEIEERRLENEKFWEAHFWDAFDCDAPGEMVDPNTLDRISWDWEDKASEYRVKMTNGVTGVFKTKEEAVEFYKAQKIIARQQRKF